MRILICSNAYPPHFLGGAELMAHEQGKALSRIGHEVAVFAGRPDLALPSSDPARHMRSDEMFEGLRIHRLTTAPEDYSPEFLNFCHPAIDGHFRDVLEEFRPDVAHFHNLTGLSVKLPILARQAGVRTICTLHDFWGFCLRNTAVRSDGRPCDDVSQCRFCLPRIPDGRNLHIPMRFRKDFMRLALDHIDLFVAPSRYIATAYERAGFAPNRIAIVPNGIDLASFHPTPVIPSESGRFRILYAGHFGAHKGVGTLLEALAQLPSLVSPEAPQVELQLAGEGPQEVAYRSQIAALALGGRVNILGKVPPGDMPALYAECDLVVLPSIWAENQPVCLMEAMAAGLPVVASRIGGIPELIEHGRNGLMFTAGSEQDLAEQLAYCVNEPYWRREAGLAGRRRVEDLDHDKQARRLLALYLESNPAAALSVSPPKLYAAIGRMRQSMVGEETALADDRWPDHYFMPRAWMADAFPDVAGIIFTGRTWSVLQALGLSGFMAVPRQLLRLLLRPLTKRADDPPNKSQVS